MSYGDTKIVINSLTYDNHANNILVGVRKYPQTADSQTAEAVLKNADKRFSAINLRGLTAVISFDYGSGFIAKPTLTVMTQDDITSNGQYETVLSLVGLSDLLAEDKASKEYIHNLTDTKTVKDLLTEVLDTTAVSSTVTAEQATLGSFFNLQATKTEDGDTVPGIIILGQTLHISNRTVSSLQFRLKKVGSPTGDITFFMRQAALIKEGVPVGGSAWLEKKVLGDASTLSTSAAWLEATFDTPRLVDDDVHIYVEYQGGDNDNYVSIGYSAANVVDGEHLSLRYPTGEWQMFSDLDCGYKYSYSEAGIDVFTHTTSYTAVFDSESSLMDTYQPRDSFKIEEGESRLDVVNKLLDFVSDLMRFENDDQPHFFTTPASGNSYTSDKGEFYTHNNRKALVVPNKIVVKSFDEDDGFEGSATSATSFSLTPITGAPIRAYLTDNAQGTSVAEAVIARLEVNSQVGSDLVPMTNSEQIWNFVTVTNNWNGSTTTGNIAFLNQVSMGGRFQQFFSFGRQARKGIAGMAPKREVKVQEGLVDETIIRWGMIKELFNIIDENTDDIYERLNILFSLIETLGVKVDATNQDLSDNVELLLDEKVDTLTLFIAGRVESLIITKYFVAPVYTNIPGS